MFNGFPLRSGTRHKIHSHSIQHCTRGANYGNQPRKLKSIQIVKEEAEQSVFADYMIAYIKNPKESSKQLLEVINEFSKVEGYKISIQKSFLSYFYILVMNNSKKKFTILFTMASQRKIVNNKSVILML